MVLKKITFWLLNKFIREKENNLNAEAIIRDEEWENLKNLVGKGFTWFIITPANYEYCKYVFNLKIDKKEFVEILKSRINYLKKYNEKINLAIHLGKVKFFLDKNFQEERFKEAIKFLNFLGIKPKAFIVIDNVFNSDTMSIAKKYGLENLLDLDLYIINPLLRLINFLRLKKTFIHNIYKNLEMKYFKNIFYLFIAELKGARVKTLHAEAIVRNDLWENLKKNVVGKNFTWYLITPTNFDYCKTYFNLQMDKKEFSNVLTERIKFLKEKGENIHLHIHFTKRKEFLDREFQEEKFKEAIEFIHSCNIRPTKFVAGWWVYNNYTIKLAKNYGFSEISEYSINPFLKIKTYNGICFSFIHKYWHDFDFI